MSAHALLRRVFVNIYYLMDVSSDGATRRRLDIDVGVDVDIDGFTRVGAHAGVVRNFVREA